jgi:hypothetical protein
MARLDALRSESSVDVRVMDFSGGIASASVIVSKGLLGPSESRGVTFGYSPQMTAGQMEIAALEAAAAEIEENLALLRSEISHRRAQV